MRLLHWLDNNFKLPMLLGSIAMFILSICILLGGYFWPYGWAIAAVLFFFCFKSDSEKKGYRF